MCFPALSQEKTPHNPGTDAREGDPDWERGICHRGRELTGALSPAFVPLRSPRKLARLPWQSPARGTGRAVVAEGRKGILGLNG